MTGPTPAVRVIATIALLFLALPFIGLLADLPWTRLDEILASDALLESLRVTSIVVPVTAGIIVVLGTPVAWLLARYPSRWTSLIRALLLVPIVLPPVISGLVLLSAFGRRGLLGGALESIGVVLPFSLAGTVIAAVFVALPFYVLAVEVGFRQIPAAQLDAARLLGTTEQQELASIAIPNARNAIAAGILLAAARALGEFGATITFAGNVEGATRTLPLATFAALESDPGLARVIGLVLVGIAVAVIYALRGSLLRPMR